MNVHSTTAQVEPEGNNRQLVLIARDPGQSDLPEFLESPNLETVVAGIKKLAEDVGRNKRNIAVALNMLVDRELWRQLPGCASKKEYLIVLADDIGISVSTLTSWMRKARALDRRRYYLMCEEIDELAAFPSADLIDRALKVDLATLPMIADYLKNRTAREFHQYVVELESKTKRDSGGIAVKTPEKHVEKSALTIPQQKACAIVARGATPIVVGVDRQDMEARIEQQLAIARRREFELRRGMYRPIPIDADAPFDFSHNISCEELTSRIRVAARDTQGKEKVVAIGLHLLISDPRLQEQIRSQGYPTAVSYCAQAFGMDHSTVETYNEIGFCLLNYRSELGAFGFDPTRGLYKLLYVERALSNYPEEEERVFSALTGMSYRAFKLFARRKQVTENRTIPARIHAEASKYFARIELIQARGRYPAVVAALSEYEQGVIPAIAARLN